MAGMGPVESAQHGRSLLEVAEVPTMTILLVEHDMNMVFRAGRYHHRAGQRPRKIASGTAGREIKVRPEPMSRKPISALARTTSDAESSNGVCKAPMADSQVLFGIDRLPSAKAKLVSAAGPQWHGQDHHRAFDHGAGNTESAARSVIQDDIRDIHGAAVPFRLPAPALGLVPEGRQIFPNLTVTGKSDCHRRQ